ncbi:hypothetical protein chiPu_0030206, partial [Chiloscyllium punctatum]|nr:hypothetical protein [Chiloscyllium punctatum]
RTRSLVSMESMRRVTLIPTENDMELLFPAAAAIGFRERRSEPV